MAGAPFLLKFFRKLDRTLWSCLPSHWLDPSSTLNKSTAMDGSKCKSLQIYVVVLFCCWCRRRCGVVDAVTVAAVAFFLLCDCDVESAGI